MDIDEKADELISAFIGKVRDWKEEHKVSDEELGLRCGMGLASMNRILNSPNPLYKTALKISVVTGVQL